LLASKISVGVSLRMERAVQLVLQIPFAD